MTEQRKFNIGDKVLIDKEVAGEIIQDISSPFTDDSTFYRVKYLIPQPVFQSKSYQPGILGYTTSALYSSFRLTLNLSLMRQEKIDKLIN